MALRMPAEWERHARTWMALPPAHGFIAKDDPTAREAWIATANAVATFEPVTLLVDPADHGWVSEQVDERVTLVDSELDDGWLRDSGPSFVVDYADGSLAAVGWVFNAWGGIQDFARDAMLAPAVADLAHVPLVASTMVNEGGGICVDGEGTVIVTETVQLHGRRNPGWTKTQVEDELARTIGATTVIWLERGLMGDMQQFRPNLGTNGHVDVLAAFLRPGVVAVHGQPDPDHHDHEVMRENVARLRAARDADGRELELVTIDAPGDTVVDGVSIDHSYLNFSFVNDGLVVSVYGDEAADTNATRILGEHFPDRRQATVDARPIFRNGGGVHCITQQQPAVGMPQPAS